MYSQVNMPTVETSEGRVGDKIVTLLWMGSSSPIAHRIQLTRTLQNDLGLCIAFDRVLGWVLLPSGLPVWEERDFAREDFKRLQQPVEFQLKSQEDCSEGLLVRVNARALANTESNTEQISRKSFVIGCLEDLPAYSAARVERVDVLHGGQESVHLPRSWALVLFCATRLQQAITHLRLDFPHLRRRSFL